MILRKEIEQIAENKGVARDTVDKDWVLGHFLAAIYSEPTLKKVLIFKGGTCLKKCWFPDYRFSEDLDFTSRKEDFELTKEHADFICDHVNKHASILTHIVSLTPLKFENKLTGYEVVIKFWGANHAKNDVPPSPERWHSKIKIEVILFEVLLFDQVDKKIIHDYSDQLALEPNLIPCYQIEEMLAEKLRALIQRSYTAPRDYYDIWFLSNSVEGLDWKSIVKAFYEKMKFKKIEFTGVEQFINEDNDKKLRAAWKNSLGHQIPATRLPDYEDVTKYLTDLLKTNFQNG